MSDFPSDDPTEYEQIPWSHLVPVQKDRTLQLAGLAIVIIASLVAIALLLRRPPAAIPTAATDTTIVNEAPTDSTAEPAAAPTTVPPATVALPAEPQVYSEADLMAALPPRPELSAVARAEWFVTDYFTVDGDPQLAAGVMAGLAGVVDLPATDGSAISYVEWARAVDVADGRDGTYTVTVWFRTLVGDGEGGFARTAVRAVTVPLVTDASGLLAIADLPTPVPVEPLGVPPAWPDLAAAPPEAAASGAETASTFGDSPELVASGRDQLGWRFVYSVGDASGLRFPVTVRVPG